MRAPIFLKDTITALLRRGSALEMFVGANLVKAYPDGSKVDFSATTKIIKTLDRAWHPPKGCFQTLSNHRFECQL